MRLRPLEYPSGAANIPCRVFYAVLRGRATAS
ncbi:MAG TPA: hypothetical protein DCE46_09505 [Pantoea sp.]|nr:hypothetical protein [Pantoea sp.]